MDKLLSDGKENVTKLKAWIDYIKSLEKLKSDLKLEEKLCEYEHKLKEMESWNQQNAETMAEIAKFVQTFNPGLGNIPSASNPTSTSTTQKVSSIPILHKTISDGTGSNSTSPSTINPTLPVHGTAQFSEEQKIIVTNIAVGCKVSRIMLAATNGTYVVVDDPEKNRNDPLPESQYMEFQKIANTNGPFEIFQNFALFKEEFVLAISSTGEVHIFCWKKPPPNSNMETFVENFSGKNLKRFGLPEVVQLLDGSTHDWKLFPKTVSWDYGEKKLDSILTSIDHLLICIFPSKGRIKQASLEANDSETDAKFAVGLINEINAGVDADGLPFWVRKINASVLLTTAKRCRAHLSGPKNKPKFKAVIQLNAEVSLSTVFTIPTKLSEELWAVKLDLENCAEKLYAWWKSSATKEDETKAVFNFTFKTDYEWGDFNKTDVVTTVYEKSTIITSFFTLSILKSGGTWTVPSKCVFIKRLDNTPKNEVLIAPSKNGECQVSVLRLTLFKVEEERMRFQVSNV